METEAICTVWTQMRSDVGVSGSERFLLQKRWMKEDRYWFMVGAFPFFTVCPWQGVAAGLTWQPPLHTTV